MRITPQLCTLAVTTALTLGATTERAEAFQQITDPETFNRIVIGRELTRAGIRLQVHPEGRISGRGMGYPVTGEWQWRNGYFCRTLDWGGSDLGYNCQAVQADGNRVRFVSDQGSGESAVFRLR